MDPENQLCTDDFAGHFVHNVNLSVKIIMGIASFGNLSGMLGKPTLLKKILLQQKKLWMPKYRKV